MTQFQWELGKKPLDYKLHFPAFEAYTKCYATDENPPGFHLFTKFDLILRRYFRNCNLKLQVQFKMAEYVDTNTAGGRDDGDKPESSFRQMTME